VPKLRRFGLITTNSLKQAFNRKIVATQLAAKPPLSLVFAIPDHPWINASGGAAVRIAMTVGVPGHRAGRLRAVVSEEGVEDDAVRVSFRSESGGSTQTFPWGATSRQRSRYEQTAAWHSWGCSHWARARRAAGRRVPCNRQRCEL
jgi:hypothetical protein